MTSIARTSYYWLIGCALAPSRDWSTVMTTPGTSGRSLGTILGPANPMAATTPGRTRSDGGDHTRIMIEIDEQTSCLSIIRLRPRYWG